MPNQQPPRLEAGKKYRVRYKVPGVHRVPREMVAVYLGTHKPAPSKTELQFSGRPVFGTTHLDQTHVFEVWAMPPDAQPYADRKVTS